MLKPNTTVYLLADTGMSWDNSIWWDKYAYQSGPYEYQGYWHHVKGLWFKAHACFTGYWYMEFIRPNQGIIRAGRTPAPNVNSSIPQGEQGLYSTVNDEMSKKIPIADIFLGTCDYLMFTNGYDDDASRQYFAFIDRIDSVNMDTCIIHFTLDAIETYGEYFNFGPCMVSRDMQHVERAYNLTPILDNENYESEPIVPATQDYVFQRLTGSDPIYEKSDLGLYSKAFITSDVSLSTADIRPNEYYGGLPSFKLSPESREGSVSLGVGGYFMPSRRCEVLDLLGSYNAVEHILLTYLVPEKLVNVTQSSGNPVMIGDFANILQSGFKGETDYILKTPIAYTDNLQASPDDDGYKPLNLKCYHAPYTYVSISDGQGSSEEVPLENLRSYEQTEQNYYNLDIIFNLSAAPNVASCLYVKNAIDMSAGLYNPLLTLWQMPSYSMTPNNSGYNYNFANAAYLKGQAIKEIAIGAGLNLLSGVASGIAENLAVANSMPLAYGTAVASNVAKTAGDFVGGLGKNDLRTSISSEREAKFKEAYGLPKAVGGLAQGFTRFNMQHVGYQYFFVHQRTNLIKKYDLFFSIYGYQQNAFRYPHINTRRRWTYVKCDTVSIIDKGHRSAVPTWAKSQIEARLKNGITFWNVRWALLGDGDENASPLGITSYEDGNIQANKGHRFVRNYGNLDTQDFLKENMSTMGGYCPDYSDYTDGLLEPD